MFLGFFIKVCAKEYIVVLFFSGIEGILSCYQACVPRIQFYGPTNFAPIIQHVSQFAAAAQQEEGARVRILFIRVNIFVTSFCNWWKNSYLSHSETFAKDSTAM